MRCGAVIVAAEMTTRMKKFRQLMNIGDMCIAERVIVNFKRAGITDIVMVTGHNAKNIEKALKGFGITFVRNENYENSQMFDSARIGLERIQTDCDLVFFCPVDVPFFTDQTVRAELELMVKDDSVDVIIPVCGGKGGHPILIRGSAIPALLAYTGDEGMRGAYKSLPEGSVAHVEVNDNGAVIGSENSSDYIKLIDLHNEKILHPQIKLLFASTSPFFGPGGYRLLKEIVKCGNVREACGKCGFSYTKGWSLIRNCEEKFGFRIVERQAGGQTGGTARVTEKGINLVAAYEELEKELNEYADKRFHDLMKDHKLTGES